MVKFTYLLTDRLTYLQTDRLTYRQTDLLTDRQTYLQTDRLTEWFIVLNFAAKNTKLYRNYAIFSLTLGKAVLKLSNLKF